MKKLNFCSLFLLLSLISCGAKEQFGSTPASESNITNGVGSNEKLTCAGSSLVKPAVDIVYVVDNSSSTKYLSDSIKTSIQNTINSVSQEFDYRIIGTPLLSTSTSEYQVLASNVDTLPSGVPSGNKISSSSQFDFFRNISDATERGFKRVYDFTTYHKNGLLRQGAHTLVILVSNGMDFDTTDQIGTGYAFIKQAEFSAMKDKFNHPTTGIKAQLQSLQFRFMTVVGHQASPACSVDAANGTVYKDMSASVYAASGSDDNGTLKDSYDLCNNGFASLFTSVNASIKQVRLSHTYAYWPVTGGGNLDPNKLQVYKQTSSSSVQLLQGTDWSYISNGPSVPSRSLPTPGETISGNMIQFLPGKEVVYPACVVIKSTEYTEYFKYAIIARDAVPSSIVVRVNGQIVPATGYEYRGLIGTPINIKVAYNGSPATPEVKKSGYMIELKSPHYYKSGDNVEVFYQSAGI